MSTEDIDILLERYLYLLDQYTTLRAGLSTLQTSVYQNIARANFSSERGRRYGQDFYDERMQASRRILISPSPSPIRSPPLSSSLAPKFTMTTTQSPSQPPEAKEDDDSQASQAQSINSPATNPMRMFGILTPLALRHAQVSALEVVEGVIPKLVSVDAEMKELEISIRRARKMLGKVAAGKAKIEAAGMEEGRGEEASS